MGFIRVLLALYLTVVCRLSGASSETTEVGDVADIFEASLNSTVHQLSSRAHAFFYTWYGSEPVDGRYFHWDHKVLPHWRPEVTARYPSGQYQPPEESGSAFWPSRGLYSSSDPVVLDSQMADLRRSGVGIVSITWWGQEQYNTSVDGEGVKTDPVVPHVLAAAEKHGIKVSMHMEPYVGRTAASFREDLQYIVDRYSSSPAFVPVYYVYDSYHISSSDWASLFAKDGSATVRGTQLDGVFIGLLLKPEDKNDILAGAFDGFYTYFSAKGFTYGSSHTNWKDLNQWAHENNKLFVPCVGPGYDDTPIRPWNAQNTRARDHGRYYDEYWQAAVSLKPSTFAVGITTFNEWGEGTQIERATPYTSPSDKGDTSKKIVYQDYEPEGEAFYMDRTRYWVDKWMEQDPEHHLGLAHSAL